MWPVAGWFGLVIPHSEHCEICLGDYMVGSTTDYKLVIGYRISVVIVVLSGLSALLCRGSQDSNSHSYIVDRVIFPTITSLRICALF